MTGRDVILANLNRTPAPRCGLTFDRGRIDDMTWASFGPSKTWTQKRWVEGDREYYDDEWGNVWWRMVRGSRGGEVCRPFLTDWRKLDELKVPDYSDPDRWADMKRKFAAPSDRFRIVSIGGWVFNDSRYLRKLEVYLADMIEYPDELDRLHAVVAGVYERKIHAAGRCGAEGITFCEDLGTQIGLLYSPALFRRYFKALYTRLFGLAHDYGMKVLMHSCGRNWDLLDDLMDAGVDCFQFDQPALYDMPALAEKLRARRVALWSPVDIQKVLPTGDRAFIEAQTDCMLDTFRGGLIMKNYGDLEGIGVKQEWDDWAYKRILHRCGVASGA